MPQAVAAVGLIFCLGMIFSSSVFTRIPFSVRLYKLVPFWSWQKVLMHGSKTLLEENLLNMLLLFPVGFLLPAVFHHKLVWWKSLLIGLVVSAGIEVSQLIFYRGYFEWDDMLHNSLGCMVGSLISGAVWDQWRKRKVLRQAEN